MESYCLALYSNEKLRASGHLTGSWLRFPVRISFSGSTHRSKSWPDDI